MSRVLETTGLEPTESEVDFQPVRGQGCCKRVFILFYTAFPRSEENTKPGEPAAAVATELSFPLSPSALVPPLNGAVLSAHRVFLPVPWGTVPPLRAGHRHWPGLKLVQPKNEKRRKYLGLHLGPCER